MAILDREEINREEATMIIISLLKGMSNRELAKLASEYYENGCDVVDED